MEVFHSLEEKLVCRALASAVECGTAEEGSRVGSPVLVVDLLRLDVGDDVESFGNELDVATLDLDLVLTLVADLEEGVEAEVWRVELIDQNCLLAGVAVPPHGSILRVELRVLLLDVEGLAAARLTEDPDQLGDPGAWFDKGVSDGLGDPSVASHAVWMVGPEILVGLSFAVLDEEHYVSATPLAGAVGDLAHLGELAVFHAIFHALFDGASARLEVNAGQLLVKPPPGLVLSQLEKELPMMIAFGLVICWLPVFLTSDKVIAVRLDFGQEGSLVIGAGSGNICGHDCYYAQSYSSWKR